MTRTSRTTRFPFQSVLVATAAATLAGCGGGVDAPTELLVRSYPAHFAADGRRFATLEALDAWVSATGASALRIEGCAQQPPNSMLAAAARFQHLYLDLRLRSANDADCAATAADVPIAMGEGGAGGAVDQYWQRVAP